MSVFRRGTALLAAATVLLVGCTSTDDGENGQPLTVFEFTPGMCFNPPGEITSEISELTEIPCDVPHLREAYAVVPFRAADGTVATADTAFPGDMALNAFADGACAEAFSGYVGVSYLDSSLWYSSLLPSPRSWEQGNDRNVMCYIVASTEPLTASVRGSRL